MELEDAPSLDQVYPALGRLAVNSALLESRLGALVMCLADSEHASLIFEGQTVDWLVKTGKAVLNDLAQTERFVVDYARVGKILDAVSELNGRRNRYVHGQWSTRRWGMEGDKLKPREGRRPADHRIFYVCKSRYRNSAEEWIVAVADLEADADQMLELVDEISEALREVNRLRWVLQHLYPSVRPPDLDDVAINVLGDVIRDRAAREGVDLWDVLPPPR